MSLRTSQGRLTWVGCEPPLQRCWTAVRKCTEKGDGLGRPSVRVCVCVCVCVCVSHSVMSDSLPPHGLWPARLLCLWNSPSKNTGMGCYALLQGNLPDPGKEPGSPALAGRFFSF